MFLMFLKAFTSAISFDIKAFTTYKATFYDHKATYVLLSCFMVFYVLELPTEYEESIWINSWSLRIIL